MSTKQFSFTFQILNYKHEKAKDRAVFKKKSDKLSNCSKKGRQCYP